MYGYITAQAIQDTLLVFDTENEAIGWKSSTCDEVQSELNIIKHSMNPHPHKRPKHNP